MALRLLSSRRSFTRGSDDDGGRWYAAGLLAADHCDTIRDKHSGVGGGEDDDLMGCYANLKHCCGANVNNEEMV